MASFPVVHWRCSLLERAEYNYRVACENQWGNNMYPFADTLMKTDDIGCFKLGHLKMLNIFSRKAN